MNTEPAIVIIGAGQAGARAAATLRENEYSGPITLIGAERHLPYGFCCKPAREPRDMASWG